MANEEHIFGWIGSYEFWLKLNYYNKSCWHTYVNGKCVVSLKFIRKFMDSCVVFFDQHSWIWCGWRFKEQEEIKDVGSRKKTNTIPVINFSLNILTMSTITWLSFTTVHWTWRTERSMYTIWLRLSKKSADKRWISSVMMYRHKKTKLSGKNLFEPVDWSLVMNDRCHRGVNDGGGLTEKQDIKISSHIITIIIWYNLEKFSPLYHFANDNYVSNNLSCSSFSWFSLYVPFFLFSLVLLYTAIPNLATNWSFPFTQCGLYPGKTTTKAASPWSYCNLVLLCINLDVTSWSE